MSRLSPDFQHAYPLAKLASECVCALDSCFNKDLGIGTI